MSIKRELKKFFTVKNTIITIVIVVAIVAACIIWGPALWGLFSDADKTRQVIKDAGVLGPILFVLLQIAQTVLAPIPANITTAVGGVAFGGWGFPLTVIGSGIGMVIVVAISRKWGRPLLEKMFKKKDIEKLDWILEHPAAEVVLFLIFLLPMMPDDIVGYLAGLTKIPFKRIMMITIIGKMPMQLLTKYFGTELMGGNLWIAVGILGAMIIVAWILYIKRRWFTSFLKSDNPQQHLQDTIDRKTPKEVKKLLRPFSKKNSNKEKENKH
jgi:uncharacterized membrane protein YdjX (TVP38/TMEM64 family)